MLNLEWKPVKDFEGFYEVSENGDIRTVARYVKTSRGNGTKLVTSRIRKPSLDGAKQYLTIDLWRDGKGKTKQVHTCVAEAFLDKLEHHTEVNHIDGNKLNNNVCNLEWCTSSENKIHARELGLYKDRSLSGDATSKAIGVKWSKSSKFNNVGWDSNRQKWTASIKHNGKTYKSKRFVDEIEAALYVDMLLDEVGDTIRPRNSILINA